MATLPTESLSQQAYFQEVFCEVDEVKALQMVVDAFVPELQRLKNASTVSDPMTRPGGEQEPSPSCQLFQKEYNEVNRTLVSVLALRWIWTDDYHAFTRSQNHFVRLKQETFAELRRLFKNSLDEPADFFNVLTSTIINDLGKDPALAEEVSKMTGSPARAINHDMVIYRAVKADLIPCLQRLDEKHKRELCLGLNLGSTLNGGQLAQGENVPGSLQGLLDMKGHRHAFNLKFLELLLDVAGAAGDIDGRGAKSMIEPVAQAYLTTYQVAVDIIEGRSSLREGYDAVLAQRAEMLQEKGFTPLSVKDPQQRALLRMLLMSRTADAGRAEIVSRALEDMDVATRAQLVNGLNVDGYQDGKAVLPYYMPAMFAETLGNVRQEPSAGQIAAISSLMRFLARVLDGTRPRPGEKGEIVERNMMFASATVKSEAFRRNPAILDELKIPDDC